MRKKILLLIIIVLLFEVKVYATDSIIDLNKKYTYDNLLNDISTLKIKYKNLIKSEVIGKSVDNRDIMLIKVGKGDTNMVLWGGLHARETVQTPVLIKLIETYCKGYNNNFKIDNYDIKHILDKVTFYIIPLANPDGYVLTTEGIDKLKNKNIIKKLKKMRPGYLDEYVLRWTDGTEFAEWKANINGVDLNRNFPVKRWGLIINKPDSNIYKTKPSYAFYSGPYKGSEPETKALIKLLDSINFYGFIDFHSRGEIIYWEKFFEDKEYNTLQKQIVNSFGKLSGYRPVDKIEQNRIDGREGNSTDFVSEKYGKPAFTVESIPQKTYFPLDTKYFNDAFEKIKAIPLDLAKTALELKLNNYYEYKVYNKSIFFKDFRILDKAIHYASKYENSIIINKDNNIIWVNKNNSERKETLNQNDQKPFSLKIKRFFLSITNKATKLLSYLYR